MILLPERKPQADVTEGTTIGDCSDQVGLLTVPQFFQPELCAQLRSEMRQSLTQLAMIRGQDDQPTVDQTVRRTDAVKISSQSWAIIEGNLMGLKPQIEQCFKTDLSGIDDPEILCYHEGHFFSWHTDGSEDDPMTRNRKVTTLIYLNGADEESGTDYFIGGALNLYAHDLIPQEEYKARCLTLSPKTGLLVAFGSRVLHRVQPILKGTRYVIVTHWISQSS